MKTVQCSHFALLPWLALFIVSLLGFTCNKDLLYLYEVPQDLQDGIVTGNMDEVAMDSQPILKAARRIQAGKYGEVHSMLIWKNGKLVFEAYFPGHDYQWDAKNHHGAWTDWDATTPHAAHSVSKSITSLCIGIGIENGFIEDVQVPIFSHLPQAQYLKTSQNDQITIEHLLTGTSGLAWAEWSAPLSSRENDQIGIWFHEPGPIDFVLSRPVIAPPGTYFTYSGGNIDLLAVILEDASNLSFPDFSRQYLFDPLALDSAYWNLFYPTGEVHAAGGLILTPREMLKIGIMMLHQGVWNDQPIITQGWVEKCQTPYLPKEDINVPGEDLKDFGYSYAWWTHTISQGGQNIHWYSANGWGGQKIIMLPELNAVVVFTGANYTKKVKQYAIMEDYILEAMD